MRLFSALPFVALAASAATTLDPRQSSSDIKIHSVSPFCNVGSQTGSLVNSELNLVTIGFTDSLIRPDAGSPDAECSVEIVMTYPPGCHTGTLNAQIVSYLEGPESVTATSDVVVALSNGRSSRTVDTFVNLDDSLRNNTVVYNTKYPIDGSIAVNQDTPRDVTFTLTTALHIESSNNDEGAFFEIESITFEIVPNRVDPDWEGCL